MQTFNSPCVKRSIHEEKQHVGAYWWIIFGSLSIFQELLSVASWKIEGLSIWDKISASTRDII